MGLRDMLKKKGKTDEEYPSQEYRDTVSRLAAPEVTFIRSDTFGEEVIHPPSDPSSPPNGPYSSPENQHLSTNSKESTRRSLFSSSSSRSRGSSVSSGGNGGLGSAEKDSKSSRTRRLSQRLHLSRSPASSENVPQDLPEIVVGGHEGDEDYDRDGAESQWEKRATILAAENERVRSRPPSRAESRGGGNGNGGGTPSVSAVAAVGNEFAHMSLGSSGGGGGGRVAAGGGGSGPGLKRSPSPVSSKAIDEDIQEAIRLHEEGELEQSTKLFGRLADPNGANNPLSQVLYGLALRHGWGCEPNPSVAVHYLSKAASNAATVENLALQAGMKKGGAAKGELVLAIFELANCFRHGWGVPKDAVAAKQYYETAANLGDTDAMNEVAWCYLEGFGCKKDKFASAKYYRLAEQKGNKTLGNSWIWKDKYDPGKQKK